MRSDRLKYSTKRFQNSSSIAARHDHLFTRSRNYCQNTCYLITCFAPGHRNQLRHFYVDTGSYCLDIIVEQETTYREEEIDVPDLSLLFFKFTGLHSFSFANRNVDCRASQRGLCSAGFGEFFQKAPDHVRLARGFPRAGWPPAPQLMTTKMTCRTMQRTGANHAVRMESSVTWWIAWNNTLCVHSWRLTALSTMRTSAKTFRSAFMQNLPLSSDVNRHVSTVCMWKKSCTASDQNQSWKSRNVESLSSMRREIRHAGLVDGRAIGLVMKFAQIWLEIDQHLAARRGHGTPIGAETCRRQTKST